MHTGLIKSASEEAEHKGLWQLLTGSAMTGVGGKLYIDSHKLKNISTDWENAAKSVTNNVEEFISPVTGKKLALSPQQLDEAMDVYYNGAHKTLNKRILGLKAGTLYRKAEALKKRDIKFAGAFGAPSLGHEAFYQLGSKNEALAHHLRDYDTWMTRELRDAILPYKLQHGDKVMELGDDANDILHRIRYNPLGYDKSVLLQKLRSADASKNLSDIAKARYRKYADFLQSGAELVSAPSDLAKKIGINADNFNMSTIYDGLIDQYKNATDNASKLKFKRLIDAMEDNVLKHTDNYASTFASHLMKEQVPKYAELTKRVGKWGKRIGGVSGLAGLGLVGYGTYKNLNN